MRVLMLARLAVAAAVGVFAYRHAPDVLAHAHELADSVTAYVKELTR